MPVSSKCASDLLSAAISRSPWRTCTLTNGWLSIVVEKTSVARAGSDVLRAIRRVNTPPIVSMPSESGVTSSSRTSWTSPVSTPAWTAAPTATTSSGLTRRLGFLAEHLGDDRVHARHARLAADEDHDVDVAARSCPASASARLHGSSVACTSGSTSASRSSRSICRIRWRGWPSAPAAKNGRLISVVNAARQLDLRALGGVLEPLQRHAIAAQVHAVVLLGERREHVLDDRVVEVLAAEERVAGRRAHAEHAVVELEDRDIERAAAEVVDRDARRTLRSRRRTRARPRSAR